MKMTLGYTKEMLKSANLNLTYHKIPLLSAYKKALGAGSIQITGEFEVIKHRKDFKTDHGFLDYANSVKDCSDQELEVLAEEYRAVVSGMSKKEERISEDSIEFDGRVRPPNTWFILDNDFVFAGKFLNPSEKLVWIAIYFHSWHTAEYRKAVWPSLGRLANMTGLSVSTVQRGIQGLKEKKLLTVLRQVNDTNRYVLHDFPTSWMRDTVKLMETEKKARQKLRKENEKKVRQIEKEFQEKGRMKRLILSRVRSN